ncbi:MAG: PTS fructose transporter subunit IIA [Gammaproteobacteria bacterium]|nr:PTS fructose transporter subunit IIA [Gammaproteobacteria bacterium]
MSVAILIITHAKVGDALLETADKMLGGLPLSVKVLPIPLDCEPTHAYEDAKNSVKEMDQGDGILVLTDMYGSTPSNVASQLLEHTQLNVVTGVNLPMLIRVLNYPRLNLEELTLKAISGGNDGIIQCKKRGSR